MFCHLKLELQKWLMQPSSAVASSHYKNSSLELDDDAGAPLARCLRSIAIRIIQKLKQRANMLLEILIVSSVSAIYTIKVPDVDLKTRHAAFSLPKNSVLCFVSCGVKGTAGPHQESEASCNLQESK